MLKIYSLEDARKSILKRDSILSEDIPIPIKNSIKVIFGKNLTPLEVVKLIIEDVKKRKDQALIDWTSRLDNAALTQFEFFEEKLDKYLTVINPKLRRAMEIARDRILAFHQAQPITNWMRYDLGGNLGQKITPIEKVGIYIPGGKTPLFSSILMSAIPAIVAGTKEIVFTTPPDTKGELSPEILAACSLIKDFNVVVRIFKLGGVQAIAALAYGTDQVPKVDKIVGPGNIFVNLAKKEVYGQVGIDGIYGPTEALIIADESANPRFIASDLLAQAEHDYSAIPILLTHDKSLTLSVQEELNRQFELLERKTIIKSALEYKGGIIFTNSLNQSIEVSNEFAPEHLSLMIRNPWEMLTKIRNAGGVFVGENSYEVLGDYIAGPSHIMPTSGSARFSSPLSVIDFIKITNIVSLNDSDAQFLSEFAEIFGESEGLTAHSNAVNQRRMYNNLKKKLKEED
jgi:histidinol dehydrogenase